MKRMGEKLLDDYKLMKKYMKLRDKFLKNIILKTFFNYLIDKKRAEFILKYSCDISPICTLGEIDFRHPLGIVIGAGVTIEDEVVILQNVTIGAHHLDGKIPNTYIERGTLIGTGAVILGNVRIGKNCIIGANSVITKNIPNESVVVGTNRILVKKEQEYLVKFKEVSNANNRS